MKSSESGTVHFSRLISHLQNKWGNGRGCPMCAEKNWGIDDAYQLTRFGKGDPAADERVMPIVPVICQNCGYTVLVSAILAGVIGPPAQPS